MPTKKRTRRGPRKAAKAVAATVHRSAGRLNIPSAEDAPIIPRDQRKPVPVRYKRNADLDPQLVWRGKDEQDWSDLVVPAPPLYIQEKIQPKALVDDLLRETKARREEENPPAPSLFGDFNGLPEGAERTDFYQHRGNWSNRMILGDSLRVMASLAEREGLRGKVQCIYMDPPYGIKFNSNFQWSTRSRDVKDGRRDHISREPEQVRAFRDTWQDGIHSYLTYLRDRLTVARDLLTESGSFFVQIGDENVHRVRALMDEVFGEENFVREIAFRKTSPLGFGELPRVHDAILWYARSREAMKYRQLFVTKMKGDLYRFTDYADARLFAQSDLKSSGYTPSCTYPFGFLGRRVAAQRKSWRTHAAGMNVLLRSRRLSDTGHIPRYKHYFEDFPYQQIDNLWNDTSAATALTYVVQTTVRVVQRCVLMTSDPGDLVLDPTCGSGTTTYVAERWGRRWITIDTSRVALALARARIMGARYPFYTLLDSPEGREADAKLSGRSSLSLSLSLSQESCNRRHSSWLCVQACSSHHAQGHREQHRD